jgi:hypothetical protein
MTFLGIPTDIIIAFLTGIVGPILLYFVKLKFDRDKIKKKSQEDLVTNSIIDSQLIADEVEYIRNEIKADRVYICQFHNGGHFYPTGRSIQKFSMFYESDAPGISMIRTMFQNIPTSLFNKALSQLSEKDSFLIPDFNDDKVTHYGLKQASESSGSKTSYFVSIKTLDDKFIAFLGIDYVSNKKELTTQEISFINFKAQELSGYIMNFLESR